MEEKIVRLGRSHLDEAAEVLRLAFAPDPMTQYVFSASQASIEVSGRALFIFSCEVRLLLNWPLLGVLDGEEKLAGVAGLSLPGAPEWPEALHEVYTNFKQTVGPESASRLEAYAKLADTNRPSAPHYQLGVIGVLPDAQGRGYGGLMLDELHRMSEDHPASTGVWLDTESERNVSFYEHYGYVVKSHTTLDNVHIWGMFRPNPE